MADGPWDTSTDSVVDEITVGSEPRYAVVTLDGSAVFVSNNSSGDVTRIDTGDGSTTDIPTGGSPRNVALSSDGSTVYVALQSSDIAAIVVADGSVSAITFPDGSCTYGVAVVPGSDLGYVTDECNEEGPFRPSSTANRASRRAGMGSG